MAQLTVENMTELLSQGMAESFLNSALALRDEVKKDIWSVCFSENGFNETLWLKYADQHKGFVQIYDLEDNENFLCGKQEKCANCGIKIYGTPLYPIYYSDIPYDATDFAKIVMLHKLEEITGNPMPKYLYELIGSGIWEREKTTLIKKKCHECDEEWRMITGCIRMGQSEENLVVSMAKEAGIKNIYRSYIDSMNRLNAVLL